MSSVHTIDGRHTAAGKINPSAFVAIELARVDAFRAMNDNTKGTPAVIVGKMIIVIKEMETAPCPTLFFWRSFRKKRDISSGIVLHIYHLTVA